MADNMYQLAGKVNVPAEKREEMNRYSIFEKKRRKTSTYDLHTCELCSEDRGYDEFGVVMNMIMVLQEVYTDGGCYLVQFEKLYHIPDFPKILFYKVIQREHEDEFLEFWDGDNLVLSQDMPECMQRWKEQFDDISVPSGMLTESFLAKLLSRLKGGYFRYVDQAFVTEFIEQGDDLNHRKALILLAQLLDQGQEYFPELTGEQADEWIIQGRRDKSDRVAISALVSLLTNKRQRNQIFGF